MINFFIAVFGAGIALYGTLLSDYPIASLLISVFLIVVSVLFFLIDLRNRFDVKQSQSVICQIERDYQANKIVGETAYGVFSNEDNTFILYKRSFRKSNQEYSSLQKLYKKSLKDDSKKADFDNAFENFCNQNKQFSPSAVKESLRYFSIPSLSSCIKFLYALCAGISVCALIFSLIVIL